MNRAVVPGEQKAHLLAGLGDDSLILGFRGPDALELELDEVLGEGALRLGQGALALENVLAVFGQSFDGFASPVQLGLVTVQVLPEIRTVVKTVRKFQRMENHNCFLGFFFLLVFFPPNSFLIRLSVTPALKKN